MDPRRVTVKALLLERLMTSDRGFDERIGPNQATDSFHISEIDAG